MARRNDHTHEEIKLIAIEAGKQLIINDGFSNFSSRRVAKDIGYSIGTIYNIFENNDEFILHINALTLDEMSYYLNEQLEGIEAPKQAMKILATSYIYFANENYNRWSTLYEHSMPKNTTLPEWFSVKIKNLTTLIEKPLLPLFDNSHEKAKETAQVLWASVHGICQLGLTGKLDFNDIDLVINLSNNFIEHYMTGLVQSLTK